MKMLLDAKGKVFDLIQKLTRIQFNGSMPVYVAEVKPYKLTRSSAQNRMMWMWLKLIADHITEHTPEQYDEAGQIILFSDDDMHEWFKSVYLPTKIVDYGGKIIRVNKSTARLKTDEFTNYLEKIDMYAAQHLNLVLPHPDDLYWKAMGAARK